MSFFFLSKKFYKKKRKAPLRIHEVYIETNKTAHKKKPK